MEVKNRLELAKHVAHKQARRALAVMAAGAVAAPAFAQETGAIDVADPGLDTVEGFSSQGPSRIVFPAAALRALQADHA